jgi:hypothetical protein
MIEENHPWLAGMLNQTHRRMVSRLPAQESRYLDQPPGLREGISMSRYAAKKIAPKHANRRNLIPVVSDLESLSLCASRTLRAMATHRRSTLPVFTLADLRTAFEDEFVELREAIEELDLLIEEQGRDTKAILLDLEPAEVFEKIRAKLLQSTRHPRRAERT